MICTRMCTVWYEQCLCTHVHVHVVGRDHMHSSHLQQSVWKPFHKNYVMVMHTLSLIVMVTP